MKGDDDSGIAAGASSRQLVLQFEKQMHMEELSVPSKQLTQDARNYGSTWSSDGQQPKGQLVKYVPSEKPFARPRLWKSGVSQWFLARYILTFMGFLGFFNVYAMRVNLSVALVAMVNDTSLHRNISSHDCPVLDDLNKTEHTAPNLNGKFNWDTNTQGQILGAFFYGYVLTQIPGGRMAELFGAKWLYGLGVLCTAIFTLLTPIAANLHLSALIIVRVMEGLGEGVTFPAMNAMLGRWLPKSERGFLSTLVYTGSQIGTVVAMPISGFLCESDVLGGWPSVFYVFGFLACIWFVFWILLVHETPEDHPRISAAELQYIITNQGEEKAQKNPPIPWRAIATSVPLWALVVTHFGQNWGFYTLLTEMPTYLSTVLHYEITQNGIISSLPYLLQAIFSWIAGYSADWVRRKNYANINSIRKFCNSVGFFGPAICLLGITFSRCNSHVNVALLILSMGFNGFIYSGFNVTHVDMSPDFSGTLMGITNGIANLSGFMAPAVVGALTGEHKLWQWNVVFYLASGVYVSTALVYIFYGSAELQPWGVAAKQEERRNTNHREMPFNY